MRRAAAAVALVAAVAFVGCGEKEERVPETPVGDVYALVEAGLGAAGSTRAEAPPLTYVADGSALRIRLGEPTPSEGLLRTLTAFSRMRARVVPFCPKPAILGCKPGLQASGTLRRGARAAPVAAALRALAAQKYEQRPLLRRVGRDDFDIVTVNGELLGAVRADGGTVRLSFGGAPPPARVLSRAAGLRVDAGPEAIAAIRRSLPERAERAVAGVSRLVVTAPLR